MRFNYKLFVLVFLIALSLGLVVACGGGGGGGGVADPYTRTADTAGDWQVRMIHLPGNETSGEGASWMMFNTTMDTTGLLGNITAISNSGPVASLFDPGDYGRFKVKGDGTVHMFNSGGHEQYFNGFMNSGSNLLIAGAGPGSADAYSGIEFVVGQRVVSGTAYNVSDLQGQWKVFVYSALADGSAGWGAGELDLNASGIGTVFNSQDSSGGNFDSAVDIDMPLNDGRVSIPGSTFDGFMSADKNLMVGVSTPNPKEAEVIIFVRASNGTTYDAVDLAGSYGMVSAYTGKSAVFNSSGWGVGTLVIGLDGLITGTQVRNENLTGEDMFNSATEEMYAFVNQPYNGGYVKIEGYDLNETTGDRETSTGMNGPYVMALSGDKDIVLMVNNSVDTTGPSAPYVHNEISILHRASGCPASECGAGLRARTADLAGNWRASWLMISNNTASDDSHWGIFDAAMTADGVINMGFSNMLDPSSGVVTAIPPGEGPDGGVLRADQDGRVWSANAYYEDMVGFMNSSGDLVISISGNYELSKGITETQLVAIQNRADSGNYDLTTDVGIGDEWRLVYFGANSVYAGWGIMNLTVSDNSGYGLYNGCMGIGVELRDDFTTDASMLGGKVGIALGDTGDFGFENSVGCATLLDTPQPAGYMSIDRETIFAVTNSGGGEPEMWSFVKVLDSPGAYSQDDLTGNWRMSQIRAGQPEKLEYGYGRITVAASSGVTTGSSYSPWDGSAHLINDKNDDGVADVTITLTMDTNNGEVEIAEDGTPSDSNFMFMGANKSIIYMLETDTTNNTKSLFVFQKEN